jgi:hypothetical protein
VTPTSRDLLGVPALPPGKATAAATRVRAALGRVHAAMAPPPVQILEGLFGVLDHRVLVALCDAGVPDALTGPADITALAARLDADAAMLERLLRYAATRGWVRLDRRGRVRPTRVTAFLRTDHPGGWRAWVDFAGSSEVVAAVSRLSTGRANAFAAANGAPFFDWMAAHPDRWAVFDAAMAAGGRMHALVLAGALDWSGVTTVCDVGGGNGALLAALLDLVPSLERGTVIDLPAVVERAVDHPRLDAVAGDAFAHVPAGFDVYLMVNVLHDWDDERAVRLLGRVAEAAATPARIVVVDGDRPDVPVADVAVASDVLMAALTGGGKERDADAFRGLAAAAGLDHERSIRLASGDLAHVFRRP